MLYSFQDLLFSISLAVYLSASVFIAVVRWGHRCEPYGRHMEYYHPAWRTFIFCFLVNLVMLPAVFMPQDPDALMHVRILMMLGSPFFCAILLFSYFGKVLKVNWWHRPVNLLVLPFALVTLLSLVLALIPGTQMEGRFVQWLVAVSGTLALLYLACFILAIRMIVRAIRRFSEENYSNPDDFPDGRFAKGVVWLSSVHLLVSWCGVFIGTQGALSITSILLAALGIVFLISALAPHRGLNVKDLEGLSGEEEPVQVIERPAPAQNPPASTVELLSKKHMDEIEVVIRRAVEQDKAYLDSHLTLASLSRHCGVNRTYISAVMSDRLGGFFNYVNRCRLDHADALRAQNPDASVEEIATASGFGTRQTYYSVKSRFGQKA